MYSSSTVDINYADIDSSLTNQIDAIAQQVADDNSDLKEVGLLGGKAGIVLLFAYLSRIFPQNYLQATFDLLDELSDSLANDELDFHLSAGVAGIGFSFQHLRNIGVLDKSEDLNLAEIDEFINLGIENDFNTGNWDPLHGMVGLGIYFLERHKETGEKKYLEKIVDYLSTMRVTVGESKVWITTGYGKYNNDNYNFGMAHGMPGILSFLAQVHTRGIKQPAIEEMISGCFPFLLQHEYKEDMEYSFPNSIDVNPAEKETDSRLAWCYGDLCMANAFIHCAKALKRNDWKVKGIEVALKTTKRNFESSGCVDAPFCHGAVGLVHQYNRLYKLTNNDVFKYAAENWLHITQKHFYKPGEGAGGYFFRTHNEEKKIFEMTANYSLLEGSAGIALVYLSWLHDIDPGWDIIFLTNV
ncbi:MAG TPA: lanthionine synthetase C family protein [Chitinophagaceae bacterium]|nr:lanthionine synthetase C family protein [Chitinophagaceae bacterium]